MLNRSSFAIAMLVATISSAHAQTTDPNMAPNARPLTDVVFESTSDRIERGRILAEGPLHCYSCHSTRDDSGQRDDSMHLGGRVLLSNDQWTLVAPNLTPDKETGTGNWTDDMLARALREGVGHDGRALYGGMPFERYQHLSDEDVKSIVVYLRTLKPVRNELPELKLRPDDVASFEDRPNLYKGVVPHPKDLVGLGKYMVELSNCASCHTTGGRNFGGGRVYDVQTPKPIVSANITSHNTGVGALTPEAFTYIMQTGKGGTLNDHMPWQRYKDLPENELAAMLAYLKTTDPVVHHVLNTGPPTFCGVCGQKHGLGELNEYTPLMPFDPNYIVPWDIAGEYRSGRNFNKVERIDGQWMFSGRRQSKTPLVPISETEFQVHGSGAVYTFELDEANKAVAMHWKNGENGNRFPRVPDKKPLVAFDPSYVIPWDISGNFQAGGQGPMVTLAKIDGEWRFSGRNENEVPIVLVSETEFKTDVDSPVFRLELDDSEKVAAVIVQTGRRDFRLQRVVD